jgi:exodeoxyribonuclease VII small subunit
MEDSNGSKLQAEQSEVVGAADEPFDAILKKLQSIVERLEREDLALEESLKAFELGMDLSRRGQQILDAAERRVEVLLKNGNTEPLET